VRIPVFHLNAFTDRPLSGNAAAVCLLDSWLDDGRLRKVAAENNLSATAFVVPARGSYDLRWFTPACEVRLCGHATIASAYILFTRFHPESDWIVLYTKFHESIRISRERLDVYDEASDSWKLVPGNYTVMAGGSSQDLPLRKDVTLR